MSMGWMNPAPVELADAGQARARSRELLDLRVDGIKLFVSGSSKARLLKGDPSNNIQTLTDVRYTLRRGKIIYGTKQ